jgi:hypothetical protein
MTMTLTWQTVITIAAVITALTVILSKYNKGYDFVQKQEEHDKEIKAIKEEQALIISGVLACLKGLSEQGCDGAVSSAILEIEEHLNKKAHI